MDGSIRASLGDVPSTTPFMGRRVIVLTRNTRSLASQFRGWSILVVLGLGILLWASGTAEPNPKDRPGAKCTEENIAGAYGFLGTGTALQNPAGLPEGLVTTVGLQTFDGRGQWKTTNHTVIVTGQPPLEVSLSGTYTVNSDCTFTLIDTAGRVNNGVFVLNRREGFFIETVEGVFVTFTMKRIGQQEEAD
jgi:hypothetical protein